MDGTFYLGISQMRATNNGKRALLIISDGGDLPIAAKIGAELRHQYVLECPLAEDQGQTAYTEGLPPLTA